MDFREYKEQRTVQQFLKKRADNLQLCNEELDDIYYQYEKGKISPQQFTKESRIVNRARYFYSPVAFADEIFCASWNQNPDKPTSINQRHYDVWDDFLYLVVTKNILRGCLIGIKSILKSTIACEALTGHIISYYPNSTVSIRRIESNSAKERMENIQELIEANIYYQSHFNIRKGETWTKNQCRIEQREIKGLSFFTLSIGSNRWGNEKADYHIWDDPVDPKMATEHTRRENAFKSFRTTETAVTDKNTTILALMNNLFKNDLSDYIKNELNPKARKENRREYIVLEELAFSEEVGLDSDNADYIVSDLDKINDKHFLWPQIWDRENIINSLGSMPSIEGYPLILGVHPPEGKPIFKGYLQESDLPLAAEIIPVIDPARGSKKNEMANNDNSFNAMVTLAHDKWELDYVKPGWIVDVFMRKTITPFDFIEMVVEHLIYLNDFAFEHNFIFKRIIIEDNLNFSSFLKDKLKDKDLLLDVIPIISTDNKEMRIHRIEPEVRNGKLKIIKKHLFKYPDDANILLEEFNQFPRTKHLDGLDCIGIGQQFHKDEYDPKKIVERVQ